MPCENCKKKCGVPIDCVYCDGKFCPRCTHLERHNCVGIDLKNKRDLDTIERRNIYVKNPKITKI